MTDIVDTELTIESVSEKVLSTRQKLEALKASIGSLSNQEKVGKTQELVALRNAIEESKKELGNLKLATTDESEIQKLLQIESDISQMETDCTQLDAEISKELSQLSQDVQPKKGRLATQREGLTSGDKRKHLLGGIGIGLGSIWLGKKIFGKKDYEDEIEGYDQMSRKEKRKARKKWKKQKRKERKAEKLGDGKSGEKKGFRDRWYGKALKWTGIVVGGALGITWLGKKFGWREKENATISDSDKDKYESYDKFAEKLENQEKFHNYESLGDKVDNVYEAIYGRELQSGYEDELEMQKIADEQSKGTKYYKGIVPYCLDNQYKSVEVILGQNSSLKAALSDGLQGMFDFVRRTAGLLEIIEDSFLKLLPSWMPFKTAPGSLSERFEQWKLKNPNAEKEMQYFFRQSIRVQTYLSQKKDQLTKKLVKEAAQKYGKSEDDIRNDQDLFDKYVLKDSQYQNFLNSPIHSAVTVLEQYNLFDNQIDEDLKKQVEKIDTERDKILGCKKGEKDILQTINEKGIRKETLDANDDKKLGEACDGVIDDMDNIIEAAEESAWNIYGDLFRSGDSNLKEYLEKSGLDKMFLSLKQILLEEKQLLKNGELDNDKKIALAETLNSILALKKEAKLGEYTIEKDYDENGNIIYRIPGFLTGSVKNIVKSIGKFRHKEWLEGLKYVLSGLLGTGGVIALSGGVWCLIDFKTGKKIASLGGKVAISPAWIVYKGATHIKPVRDFGHKINPLKYRGEKGAETLLADLVDGKISLERAGKIIERRSFGWFTGKDTEKLWKKTFDVADDLRNFDMRKIAFDSMVKKQCVDSYLSDIKRDDKLYHYLINNYDKSADIRRAVKSQTSLEELKKLLPSVPETVDVVSDIKKAFDASIDKAIAKLNEVSNPDAVKIHIDKLKTLKTEAISVDEMECFTKFINEGFDAKLIPELKKLVDVDATFKSGEKIGERLKKLLANGQYDEFKSILRTPEFGKIFKGIQINDIIKNFDNILLKGGNKFGTETAKLLKSFAKILSKIKVL